LVFALLNKKTVWDNPQQHRIWPGYSIDLITPDSTQQTPLKAGFFMVIGLLALADH